MAITELATFPTTDVVRGNNIDIQQTSSCRQLFIFALELRTLSWVYRAFDGTTGVITDTLAVYNENKSVTSLQYAAPTGSYTTTPYAIPSSSFMNFTFMGIIMALPPGAGFSIHPDGHWSYSRPVLPVETGLPRDIVQKYRGTKTTHKALYNLAYKQSRDYSYYNTSWDGSAWVAPTGSDLDQGSFRTNGVWITFKKPAF
jgi:hypothetical protein